jgi:hypothetical protein
VHASHLGGLKMQRMSDELILEEPILIIEAKSKAEDKCVVL